MATIVKICCISVFQIFAANFFPYPFNHLNFVFSSVLLLMIVRPGAANLWTGMIVLYISELFTSIPFGVTIVSMSAGLLVSAWLVNSVITRRSAIMVMLAAAIGLVSYRLSFFALIGAYNLFRHLAFFPAPEVYLEVLWELVLSSIFTSAVYLVASWFLGRTKTNYISIPDRLTIS